MSFGVGNVSPPPPPAVTDYVKNHNFKVRGGGLTDCLFQKTVGVGVYSKLAGSIKNWISVDLWIINKSPPPSGSTEVRTCTAQSPWAGGNLASTTGILASALLARSIVLIICDGIQP